MKYQRHRENYENQLHRAASYQQIQQTAVNKLITLRQIDGSEVEYTTNYDYDESFYNNFKIVIYQWLLIQIQMIQTDGNGEVIEGFSICCNQAKLFCNVSAGPMTLYHIQFPPNA